MANHTNRKSTTALARTILALTTVIASFIPLGVIFRDNPFTISTGLMTIAILLAFDGICVGVLWRASKSATSHPSSSS